MRRLILLIPALLSAQSWEAGGPARGLTLAAGEWKLSGRYASLPPSRDYFSRAAFVFSAERPLASEAWLAIEYLDQGYGLITISEGVAQRDQWGVTRLNTGNARHAVFHLGKGALARPLRIEGIRMLRSVSLLASAPAVEPAPVVKPALTFRVPSQRVTTAGADANKLEDLPDALATMRNLLPLARALGFNGVESYVKWNFVERSPGVFDWSFYDAVVDEIERQGMQWFPLLIGGSAYALPEWYHDSADNSGFVCLEHGARNDIQSIFCDTQSKYVRRYLTEFGRHYGKRKALLGIRLGPSGNYGEAQYPARGDWGYRGGPLHTHIGYWAGDACAPAVFQRWLRGRYPDIGALNAAWGDRFPSFEAVKPFLPNTAATYRKRADFATWYMDAMSGWCDRWAEWAREALPDAVIHQSSGGWGPVEIGTDYTWHARTMARLKGGIRLTNESDNFAQNFAITRMASSAARFLRGRAGL